uniref:Uncharacterized protein n=1 Tax=Oryza glumipatula TaxID=40148 RepID=A0A0E0ATU5_9ORYZ
MAATSSAAMDWYHDATRGVATMAGVRAVGGGGVLPPQAPPPPRFGVPPRFQASEAMEEQTSSEPLDPLSHEEFLHMSNFDGMEQVRYYTNLINDESNHFESSEMGSQYADEQDPIGNENAALRPNQKRSKNFSLEEDNLLVSAWINVSFDAVQGTDQSRGTYWGRIYEYFHDNKEFDSDRSW